ncbi:hypothetical protein YC2023_100111 [Brassica napus]
MVKSMSKKKESLHSQPSSPQIDIEDYIANGISVSLQPFIEEKCLSSKKCLKK